jgi:hypothetical protein
MTWALTIWTLLMGVWIAAGAATASGDAKNCGTLTQKACNDASDAGTAIGVGLLIFLWFMGFVVLGIIWFASRPRAGSAPTAS